MRKSWSALSNPGSSGTGHLLAKVAGVPVDTFPLIATTSGNLGSSTCGAALHAALKMFGACPQSARKPIFLASLGPGLVFGGTWLSPQES